MRKNFKKFFKSDIGIKVIYYLIFSIIPIIIWTLLGIEMVIIFGIATITGDISILERKINTNNK